MPSKSAFRANVEKDLAAAVDAESESGFRWWPGNTMASVAYRRWFSFGRRHNAVNSTIEQRIADLAAGLQSQFEPEGLHTHPNEWMHLAQTLSRVFDQHSC